jgi:hypothetical protein
VTTAPDTDDDMTELVDATFPRVDLVGKGANGVPRFLIAKADEASGLFDPGYVRALIAKAEPDSGREDTVTMTGSPAAIAKLIHEGAVRGREQAESNLEEIAKAMAAYPDDPIEVAKSKAEYDVIVKAKYNADDKKRMAASGAAMPDESYPIEDEEDLDNAIHAVGRGGASHNAIRKHIITRAKSLGKSSMIPGNWAADGSLKETVSKDTLIPDASDLDNGVDGMDPTVPLAAPEGDDAPGDPTDPGSPAWEAIDAATAQKWTAIAVRLNNAQSIMADREMLEAVTADPDDADSAWDLQDAMCAVDFVIDTLAGFAVGEQAEADLAAEAMDSISKAMGGFDTDPLDRIEALSTIAKAGRVLSAANEAEIRTAAASLNKVLASLPSAPTADDQISKEAAMAADTARTPEQQAADNTPVDAGGTTGMGTPKDGAPDALPGRTVMKADSDSDSGDSTLQAVFDQNGCLVGVCDPSAIQAVSGTGKKPEASDTDAGDGDGKDAGAGDGAAADMSPQPPADAGTPADDVAKATPSDTDVITLTKAELSSAVADEVRAALETHDATQRETIAKQADDLAAALGQIEVLKGQVRTLEDQPAIPKVLTNGATPPAHLLRGQDRTPAGQPAQVDIAKAAELRDTLYHGTAPEQNKAANTMQEMAIAGLQQIHAAGR